jgi:uncharacterized protein (TIGR00369 family)
MDERITEVVYSLQQHPVHSGLDLRVTVAAHGRSTIVVPQTDHLVVGGGVVHTGVIASVCEVAAFLALLTRCELNEWPLTHDFHLSVLRPIPSGQLRFDGEVLRRGTAIGFAQVRLLLQDESIGATASVTASILEV